MAVIAATDEVGVQRVDRTSHPIDLPDGARCRDERLGEHLSAEDPAMRHPLAASDEDHRRELAKVGLVVAGHPFVADSRLADLLQVQDLEQVAHGIGGSRVQGGHTC